MYLSPKLLGWPVRPSNKFRCCSLHTINPPCHETSNDIVGFHCCHALKMGRNDHLFSLDRSTAPSRSICTQPAFREFQSHASFNIAVHRNVGNSPNSFIKSLFHHVVNASTTRRPFIISYTRFWLAEPCNIEQIIAKRLSEACNQSSAIFWAWNQQYTHCI